MLWPSHPRKSSATSGFTLIETLVALAICAALISAFTLPFAKAAFVAKRSPQYVRLTTVLQDLAQAPSLRNVPPTRRLTGQTDQITWSVRWEPMRAQNDGLVPCRILISAVAPDRQTAEIETIRLGRMP